MCFVCVAEALRRDGLWLRLSWRPRHVWPDPKQLGEVKVHRMASSLPAEARRSAISSSAQTQPLRQAACRFSGSALCLQAPQQTEEHQCRGDRCWSQRRPQHRTAGRLDCGSGPSGPSLQCTVAAAAVKATKGGRCGEGSGGSGGGGAAAASGGGGSRQKQSRPPAPPAHRPSCRPSCMRAS